MKTYEYAQLSVAGDLYKPDIAALNELGAQGWLLVSDLYEFSFDQTTDPPTWSGLFVREVTLDKIYEHWPGTAEAAAKVKA